MGLIDKFKNLFTEEVEVEEKEEKKRGCPKRSNSSWNSFTKKISFRNL